MQLVFETNFWGPVRVFQAALPLLPKTGAPQESFPRNCTVQLFTATVAVPSPPNQWLQADQSFVYKHAFTTAPSRQYQTLVYGRHCRSNISITHVIAELS